MLVGQGPGHVDQSRIEDAGDVLAVGRIIKSLIEVCREKAQFAASAEARSAFGRLADGILDASHDASFDEAISDCAIAVQTWRRHTDEDEKIQEMAARFCASAALPVSEYGRSGMWTRLRAWLSNGGAK